MPPPQSTRKNNKLRDVKNRIEMSNRIDGELNKFLKLTKGKEEILNKDDRKLISDYLAETKKSLYGKDNNGSRHTANTEHYQKRNRAYNTLMKKLSPVYEIGDKRHLPLFDNIEEEEDDGTNTLKTLSLVRREQANRLAKEFVEKLFAKRGGKSKRATRRNKNKQSSK